MTKFQSFKRPRPASNGIKVLIGTPIHKSKDYAMERWLANVSRLEYPADLLLVDNSPGLNYVKRVKGYCKKYGMHPVRNLGQSPISNGARNYKIKHLEILQGKASGKSTGEQIHERIARCREIIRREFLSLDYDAYFFWENDVIIPSDGLSKLVALMQAGNFLVVDHNCWISNKPNMPNFDYGIVLFSRECLEKYGFIPTFGTDPDASPNWYYAENWFRKRLHKDGYNYTEVMGLLEPVYHLDK